MSNNYINELAGLITDLLEIEIQEDIMEYFDKLQLKEMTPNTQYKNRKFAYEIFCVCQNILSKIPTLEERTIFLKKARKIIKEHY